MTPSRIIAAIALLAVLGAPLQAQSPDTSMVRHPRPLRAWEIGAMLAGTALISLGDKDIQHYVSTHRTQADLDLTKTWQQWGAGAVPVAITLGTLGTGLILHKPGVTRTGERLVASLGGVSVVGWVLKESFGRERPNESTDPYRFKPFSSHASFPSGHTFFAFALSTTLADAIDNRWADIGLYTLAAGTGISRVVQNKHWASDVVAGSLVGITVAKVVDDRWTVFGIHSPRFLAGPDGYGLCWTADIPALRGGAGPR